MYPSKERVDGMLNVVATLVHRQPVGNVERHKDKLPAVTCPIFVCGVHCIFKFHYQNYVALVSCIYKGRVNICCLQKRIRVENIIRLSEDR
jgi:hypothetical protein